MLDKIIEFERAGFNSHPAISFVILLAWPCILMLFHFLYSWSFEIPGENEKIQKCIHFWWIRPSAYIPYIVVLQFSWMISSLIFVIILEHLEDIISIIITPFSDIFAFIFVGIPGFVAIGLIVIRILRYSRRSRSLFFQRLKHE